MMDQFLFRRSGCLCLPGKSGDFLGCDVAGFGFYGGEDAVAFAAGGIEVGGF